MENLGTLDLILDARRKASRQAGYTFLYYAKAPEQIDKVLVRTVSFGGHIKVTSTVVNLIYIGR